MRDPTNLHTTLWARAWHHYGLNTGEGDRIGKLILRTWAELGIKGWAQLDPGVVVTIPPPIPEFVLQIPHVL